jgi:elongation factor G
MSDAHVGRLTFFRVYSGTFSAGGGVLNASKRKRERIGRILQMHANKREDIRSVYAGDIAAAVGLKFTGTGDTLCDEQSPIILEPMNFAKPVVSIAIEPRTRNDQDQLAQSLSKLTEEDPTFRVSRNEDTAQTIISGMGELHLEVLVDRLLREFKVKANVGKPQVAYKEAITKTVQSEGKFVRQSGGHGQYGHVKLELEPGEQGQGLIFKERITNGVIPKEYVSPIHEGVKEALGTGPVAGYPIEDITVTLYGGSYHQVDSSEIAFRVAASVAMRDGCKKAVPVLLEPIMDVEVIVPEEYTGDVLNDLNSRRGQIAGLVPRSDAQVIDATVPLVEMFGYATALRSLTQGRAIYTMEFSRYEEVPAAIGEQIMIKAGRVPAPHPQPKVADYC